MSRARDFADLAGSADAGGLTGRNLVINGAMQVAQRGTSATGLGDGSDAYHTVDRIQTKKGSAATAGRFTMTQSDVTDLAGFPNAVKFQCTTADTSIAASEAMLFQYNFEGQDLQSIMETSSSSKAFTVSFYAKANESRAFALEVRTSGGTNRQISKLFTASSSWQRFEFNVPAAASGMQINNDNSNEMQLNFWLHAGSTYAGGTLDTDWAGSTNANRAAGIGSLFASTSNFFEMTGLQLEVGEQATPFEHRSFGDELKRCERYYEKTYPYATAPGTAASYDSIMGIRINGLNNSGSEQKYLVTRLRTEKRASPTTTYYNDAGNTGRCTTYDAGGTADNGINIGLSISGTSMQGFGPSNGTFSGISCFMEHDAEL